MFGIGLHTLIADTLWVLVFFGWLTLILVGLEADKPLSGGLPGHVYYAEDDGPSSWSSTDQFASVLAWVIFALASASLPVILWWIFTRH